MAIMDISEAIRLDPKNADAFYSRGLVLHRKNEFDKAIADFTEVIRLDPKNVDAISARTARGGTRAKVPRHLRISTPR